MSETIEQADELRNRAITLLLTERTAIDERLKRLGYDGQHRFPNRVCAARVVPKAIRPAGA